MFKPGEVERLAVHLGLSVEETFRNYLAVDVVHDTDRDTYTLMPAAWQQENRGGMYPYAGGGVCVFLTETGLCGIQGVKPWECRTTDHATVQDRAMEAAWAREWREHQQEVERLLGRSLPDRAVRLDGWSRTRATREWNPLTDVFQGGQTSRLIPSKED